MSRAYPYRRPPVDVVETGPWLMKVGRTEEELSAELTTWDYDTILRLRRPLRVHGARVRRSCGLPPDVELRLSVVWASSSSGLRGRLWQAPVPMEDDAAMEITGELPGGELGGRLDLQTTITLASVGAGGSHSTAPRRSGSILWRDISTTVLQGDAVLFPLAVVDFEPLPYPTGAAWHLELGSDLESQALGSILLLVNQRRTTVTAALESAADPDDTDRAVLSVIRTDIVRSLVEQALVDEEFDPDEPYPTGSVGALLSAVVRHAFPGRPIDALRRERARSPMLFTTRVQNATELLAGP